MADEKMIQQAALDQMWKATEPFLPFFMSCGTNGIANLEKQDREIVEAACRLIAYELSYRILQQEHLLRCQVYKGCFSDECTVDVKTVTGHMSFFIDKKHIMLEDKNVRLGTEPVNGLIKVSAYTSMVGKVVAVLPTSYSDTVVVEKSEMFIE